MLKSLLEQKEDDGFSIVEIIVHCDNCSDNTVAIAQGFDNAKIKVIDNKQRKGFAGSVKTLLSESKSDVTVLLNDDIKIEDNQFIKKLIVPFQVNENMGLVSGNPQPLRPKTFIEKAIISSSMAYVKARDFVNNSNNPNACDGKILAVSKELKHKMLKKENFKDMANVDAYFYFFCRESGWDFEHNKEAMVYFRNPQTFSDYTKWFSRNNAQKYVIRSRFGEVVDIEYKIPLKILSYYCFLESIKNPLGAIFLLGTKFYILRKTKKYEKNFGATWNVVQSSKNLN